MAVSGSESGCGNRHTLICLSLGSTLNPRYGVPISKPECDNHSYGDTMITTSLAILLLGQTSGALKGNVISASLFKNGYAVLIREYAVPKVGDFTIDETPYATLGSLWMTTTPGLNIDRLRSTQVSQPTESTLDSLGDLVRANVGKQVQLKVLNEAGLITATIEAASASLIVFTTAEITRAIPLAYIEEVRGAKNALIWTAKSKTSRNVIQGTVTGTPGKLFLMTLERGMSWAPAYRVDISDPKLLTLTARATVINELVELKDTNMKLITGFPNLPFLGILDPSNRAVTLDQFVGGLMNLGADQNFSGRREMMTQNAARGGAWDESGGLPQTGNFQAEDLFFYRLPKTTLSIGDRGMFTLFDFKSEYSHIYEWQVADNGPNGVYRAPASVEPEDVWHSLKFKNNSTFPLTTAPAMTVQQGEVLGQDVVKYSSIGGEVRLKITKALDVQALSQEEEISRDQVQVKWSSSTRTFERVTLRGTLTIKNRKPETVNLRIAKMMTGEFLTASHSPKARKLAQGVQVLNSVNELIWEVPLEPGKTLTITYDYKLVLNN